MSEKVKCAGRVRIPGQWMGYRACTRAAKHHEDGSDWCAQHAPSLVLLRREKAVARWKDEMESRGKACERAKALDAARAAVVEAAKAWKKAATPQEYGLMVDALGGAVDAMEKLERPDA